MVAEGGIFDGRDTLHPTLSAQDGNHSVLISMENPNALLHSSQFTSTLYISYGFAKEADKHGKLYILERNSGGLDGKVSSNTPQCYEDFKAKCATYSISDNKNYLPPIQLKIPQLALTVASNFQHFMQIGF